MSAFRCENCERYLDPTECYEDTIKGEYWCEDCALCDECGDNPVCEDGDYEVCQKCAKAGDGHGCNALEHRGAI